MPIIKGHYAQMEKSADATKAKRDNLMAGMKMMKLQQKQAKELDEAKSDAEKQDKQAEMEAVMTEGMLNIMWTTTVVDITGTLHETIQLVLHDQSVDADTRKRRAYGLKHLGQIFMDCPAQTKTSGDAKKLYEEGESTSSRSFPAVLSLCDVLTTPPSNSKLHLPQCWKQSRGRRRPLRLLRADKVFNKVLQPKNEEIFSSHGGDSYSEP